MQLAKIFSFTENFEAIRITSSEDAAVLSHLTENYFKEDGPVIPGIPKKGQPIRIEKGLKPHILILAYLKRC